MNRRVVAVGAGLVLLAAACGSDPRSAVGPEPLVVAAAADLMPAFTVLGEQFEEATGVEVVFGFGSSGQLAQQLIEGAPMDVYASASASYVDQVLAAGVGDPATRVTYAFGRIALWAPDGRWRDWQDLHDVVADDDVRVIAIANPEHAPYGLAARQAFESTGLWDRVASRVVYGENVSDTQRLAATGNADAAIVALSLAIAADAAGGGTWVLIDEDLHAPLQQDLVVVASDAGRAELARRFVDHVDAEEGRRVMRSFGFVLPGEAPAGVVAP